MSSAAKPSKFSKDLYQKRLKELYSDWKNSGTQNEWKNADALVFTNGTTDEEIIYKKSTAIQVWLFGFEMENTVVVVTDKKVLILTGPEMAKQLQDITTTQVEGLAVSTELLTAETDTASDDFNKLFAEIKASGQGKSVGSLIREAALGDFAAAWKQAFDQQGFTVINIANSVSNLFAVKDSHELKYVKTAAAISAAVLKSFLVPEIETTIDEEQSITHSALAEKTENVFSDPKTINPRLSPEMVESCYTPIIQSGGQYDLKPSAVSNDDQLNFGTIICSLGARYRHYCSNVARTYLIDPDKGQEENYALLLELHKRLIKTLVPGVKLGKLMDVAHEFIQNKAPQLLPHFVKTVGFGMGLEFRESAFSLNNKNQRVAQSGMVFNICVGFQGLERKTKVKDPKKKVYALMLADTVVVTDSGSEVLTASCPSEWKEISYSVEDENEEEESENEEKSKKKREQTKPSSSAGARSTRLRDADKTKDQIAAEEKRRKHQEELERKKREEAEARFKAKKGGEEKVKAVKEVIAYENASLLPKEAQSGRIFVDQKNESVLLPIYGLLVPFHISTIKSVTRSEEFLRINFITPGTAGLGSEKSPKLWKDGKATFIREMTYRCPDTKSLTTSLRLISELRKRAQTRAHDTHVRDSLVAQEELVPSKSRPLTLPDLYIRPTIGGRRATGQLELHKNGFRFRSSKGGNVDIMFKNIKHAFFQPAEAEMIVIIHFHLYNPILVGKKKTNDIQVYSEVMEVAQSLDGRMGRRGMDRDDIDDEAQERQLRIKMNADFHNFVKKVQDAVPDMEFDIPYRELGFFGVPGRTSTFLMPTVHCLVQLVEPPFFVLTLDEVEIAHFERVQFSLKNFDLVFVFKDLSRQPAMISAIPTANLEPIKEWLDECNIKYYEGPGSLNWKAILATIRDDPKKFWDDGGWNFLSNEGSDDSESSGSEEEDAYNPSDQDDDEDSYVGSDDGAGSDFSGGDEDDESEEEDEDEESEGLDWDELEKRAAIDDKKRGSFEDEEPPSRKRRRDDYSDDDDDQPRARSGARGKAPPAKRQATGGGGGQSGAGGRARPSSSSSSGGGGASGRKPGPAASANRKRLG